MYINIAQFFKGKTTIVMLQCPISSMSAGKTERDSLHIMWCHTKKWENNSISNFNNVFFYNLRVYVPESKRTTIGTRTIIW